MTNLATIAAVGARCASAAAAETSLIVLDAASPDLQALQRGAQLPLELLGAGPAPLASVAQVLRSRQVGGAPIEVLHLVAHGRPGAVRLAGQWLDAAALRVAAADLADWSVGQIVLWSCQAGLDRDFIATLAELSGASVLASSENLGHGAAQSIKGGDGQVHRLTDLFTKASLDQWSGVLTDTITLGEAGLNFANGLKLTSGRGNPIGTTFLYSNIYQDPLTGQAVDALVMLQAASSNASVSSFDSDTQQFPRTDYFQPNVTFNNDPGTVGGSSKFHFQFIVGGSFALPLPSPENPPSISTSSIAIVNPRPGYDELQINGATPYQKINVSNLTFTAYDIDGQEGNDTARQYIETSSFNPTSVALGQTSELEYTEISNLDGTQGLRVASRYTGDSNPIAGTAGFDQADFDAHKAEVAVGTTDNFDFTVGDYSNTSLTYLALYGISFAGAPKATLGNFVFEDSNANGLQDEGESGIVDALVNLLDESGNIIASQITDSTGLYSFTDLVSGRYSVQFVAPADYSATAANQGNDDSLDSDADPTTGMTSIVSLAPGEVNTTIDAGFYKLASLGDFVWEDSNANGLQDVGEAGISGVTVTLLDGAGATLRSVTTDADGRYLFSGLTAGAYSVTFAKPSGYVFTTRGVGEDEDIDSDPDDNGVTWNVTLAAGEVNLTRDAGLYRLASLGDRVWADSNANGIQDSGEQGVAGVTVNLLNSAGSSIATTTTDGSGLYGFSGLTPGSYAVEFVKPFGMRFTGRDQGGNDLQDSDADSTSGRTDLIDLSSGENNTSLDAGMVTDSLNQIPSAPGVRTPGFWVNRTWQQFWDGNATNQNSLSQNGTATFPNGDLLFSPYNNSAQQGRVQDPVTGTYSSGVLAGDFNRNGLTDAGEDTIFYTTSEALAILNPRDNPDSLDIRYTLARDVIASWLNYVAGNPIDTAAPSDKDTRYYLREGINWLQALTPDENGDRKGDGSLSKLTPLSSPAVTSKASVWNNSFASPVGLPLPYSANTGVSYLGGIDAGDAIHNALDDYNNGRGYADGVFSGGNL